MRKLFIQTVSAVELLDSALRAGGLLLAGVERMALGAYFDVDLLVGGSCHECVAAVAGHSRLIIRGMNSFSHFISSLSRMRVARTRSIVYYVIQKDSL